MMDRFVVMGVSGCGKSSIGAAFAVRIGAQFIDADDLHPKSNVTKMASGHPLNDTDRAPWLALVGQAFADHDGPLVIACSALKHSYRDIIRDHAGGPVMFIHLDGTRALIADRMAARVDHFMPTTLLDSQFAAQESFGANERFVRVDIDQTPDTIVAELVVHFDKDTGRH